VYLARAAYCYGRNGKRCRDYIADYYINIVPPSYGERLGEYDDESLPGIFRQRRRAVIIVVLAFVCATNGAAARRGTRGQEVASSSLMGFTSWLTSASRRDL